MLKPFLIATFAAVAMLSGCATTSGLEAKVSRSGFHQSSVVDIAAHATAQVAGMASPMLGLGAQWQQQNQSSAIISVEMYGQIVGITGASLSIDGDVINLLPGRYLTDFEKKSGVQVSQKAFSTELQTVRRITEAKRVWIKVNTTKGWVEDAIIDGDKDSKAFHALKRFIAQVDAVKAESKPTP